MQLCLHLPPSPLPFHTWPPTPTGWCSHICNKGWGLRQKCPPTECLKWINYWSPAQSWLCSSNRHPPPPNCHLTLCYGLHSWYDITNTNTWDERCGGSEEESFFVWRKYKKLHHHRLRDWLFPWPDWWSKNLERRMAPARWKSITERPSLVAIMLPT